jgi:hypothetical protein
VAARTERKHSVCNFDDARDGCIDIAFVFISIPAGSLDPQLVVATGNITISESATFFWVLIPRTEKRHVDTALSFL